MKDSIEEKVIAPQAHLSTLIYLYIEYQGAKKLTSTYGQNVIDQIMMLVVGFTQTSIN